MEQSIPSPIRAAGYFLNPRYHYKALVAGALRGEVRDGLIHCIDRKIPLECDQLEIHRQVTTFNKATANWSVFERIHTKKRKHLDQKRLNDLVYVQYNLRLKRNQLLNKRPDSDLIVLEDIDPTTDWVVESHPAEFDSDKDLDLDLQVEASLEHNVQLNANPLVPASGPAPGPLVAGASSTQTRQKRISRLSQLVAAAQPASVTTSTVAVGDDDGEEPWASLSNSDPEVEPDDVGSSSSSQ
eukprot:PITA_32107